MFGARSWRHPNRHWPCKNETKYIPPCRQVLTVDPLDPIWCRLWKDCSPEHVLKTLMRLKEMKRYQLIHRRCLGPLKNKRRLARGLETLSVHHLVPASRRGDRSVGNLVRLKVSWHEGWHRWVENATLDEVISALKRLVGSRKNETKVA